LVDKSKEKRPFGRKRHRWEDNIKIDLTEMQSKSVEWIHVY